MNSSADTHVQSDSPLIVVACAESARTLGGAGGGR
jgi:hypothetical protein